MKNKFKYRLKLKGKKEICPQCLKKTFVRFEDYNGNLIPEKYGRCDREDNCTYFLSPYQDGFDTGNFDPNFVIFTRKPEPVIKPSFMDIEITSKSLERADQTNLNKFLRNRIDPLSVDEIFRIYYTGGYNKDWTVFWYIDVNGRVRSGKYIKYKENGKRYKSHESSISIMWEHTFKDRFGARYPDFNFVQCFFGEHLLLSNPKMKVGIVESEKSALISSLFLPDYLWLACGSKNGLSKEKCEVLKNRSVTLFPDYGAESEWKAKAKDFGFNISNRLEQLAIKYNMEKGIDIADVLLDSNSLIRA